MGHAYNKPPSKSLVGLCKRELLQHGRHCKGMALIESVILSYDRWLNEKRLVIGTGEVPTDRYA